MFLHPFLVGIFLAAFTILAVVGMIRLFREKHKGMAIFIFLTMLVFAFSCYTAFTLKV